jgi:hypothetical protein
MILSKGAMVNRIGKFKLKKRHPVVAWNNSLIPRKHLLSGLGKCPDANDWVK